ncbi:MAG: FAD-dependent oxidoreductase [Patescibacteria group bacterium]
MKNKKALIIGAGIHGSSVAIELGKNNYEVYIVDSNPDILMGTSGATHNRIHLGYHYPRSSKTILECKMGHRYFKKHFGDSLIYPDFYYLIERYNSRTSSAKYRSFIKKNKLGHKEEWPKENFVNKKMLAASFNVKEAYFDILKLKNILKDRFKQYNIKTLFGFNIKKIKNDKGVLRLYSNNNKKFEIDADIIINTTYTCTNNIQSFFGVRDHLTEYEFENTEIAVVSCDYEIPALTVMDGPFITIMPYGGHKGKYLVYDVLNSVTNRSFGVKYNQNKNKKSKWKLMLKHGLKYYPFFKDLKYSHSLWANRPIPLKIENQKNDDRSTRIVRHNYHLPFYSVLEGKFVSAPMVAEYLVKRIKKEINV